MDYEAMVKLITAEVMKRLQAVPSSRRRHKALAVFTGGGIGLEPALNQLQRLQDQGIVFTAVLSRPAEQVVGSRRLREALGEDLEIIDSQSPYPGRQLREAAVILVPVLTQNTAAKLALTLSDTLASTVVLQALMLGKPVLAAQNAADPRDAWRVKEQIGEASPALRQALETNLKKIAGFGVRLMPVEQLMQETCKILERTERREPAAAAAAKCGLIDAAAVQAAASRGETVIIAPARALVTPLARDLARECGLELRKET
ncbi:flavoprotein [Acetonema longum]|uniref:Flavoprotein n=1 Tax=Acetonema longum DSM 6540 TaxID=1009370 RepID=F7NH16_9FIRM|nr:flavoprotein [Acetonema longum]EGO64747.1 flavoprotein [Acetonema longum DSM 6540]